MEEIVKEAGIAYISQPPLTCQCVACLSLHHDRLASSLTSYLRPLHSSLTDSYQRLLEQASCHPLNRERDDEMVAQALDGMAIACSQIRSCRAMGLGERIEEVRALVDRMTSELVKLYIFYIFYFL